MVVPVSDEILVQEIDSLELQARRYSSPSFRIVVLFCNALFLELTHIWLLSVLSLNPYAPRLIKVVNVGTDLSYFLHYMSDQPRGLVVKVSDY